MTRKERQVPREAMQTYLDEGWVAFGITMHPDGRQEIAMYRETAKPPKPKNECAKMRPAENPYEVWRSRDGLWEWRVLKKWQIDDDKPMARWFCLVITPMTGPAGDMGDCYVSEIKSNARRVK